MGVGHIPQARSLKRLFDVTFGEALGVRDNVLKVLRDEFDTLLLVHEVEDDERTAWLQELCKELRRVQNGCEVVICKRTLESTVNMAVQKRCMRDGQRRRRNEHCQAHFHHP